MTATTDNWQEEHHVFLHDDVTCINMFKTDNGYWFVYVEDWLGRQIEEECVLSELEYAKEYGLRIRDRYYAEKQY